ncbi:MAG: tRNA-dihydrouridine synthase A [Oceanicoccus sp.]|jgi:tRNA-dihydrouridine synthase A
MRKPMDRSVSIAPMMDWSDRHCRMFWRQLSRQAVLYTEMVTTGAIIHAGPDRFLQFHPEEQPLALQLGGSNPKDLGHCAKIAEEWGFDEVNLNCGCPSDRVQSGMFGACLMAQPALVADCVKAMQDTCSIPVTVKHRIGIDDMETYQQMLDFIQPIADAGCKTFIVHARKAWLQGLSPKQNREVPPLNYPMVHQLKKDHPELEIILNGGLENWQQCREQLAHVDGVMLGRAAYHNPYLLVEVDPLFYDHTNVDDSGTIHKSRQQVLLDFMPYIEEQLTKDVALNHITRHLLGLFQGVAGAKLFRRHISQQAHKKGAGIEVVEQALALMVEVQQRNDEYHERQTAAAQQQQ